MWSSGSGDAGMEMLTERPSLRRGYSTVTFLGRETPRSYAENERGVKVRHLQKRAYRHVHEGCPAMTTPPPACGSGFFGPGWGSSRRCTPSLLIGLNYTSTGRGGAGSPPGGSSSRRGRERRMKTRASQGTFAACQSCARPRHEFLSVQRFHLVCFGR